MAAAAKSSTLLYVSDLGTFDVNVYAFPSLKPAGKLTGFDEPQGECGDAKGNVWITSTGNETIYKYAHGATQPSALLSDPLGFPIGCAVDPASGDLAVANFEDFSGGGSVLVYKRARGAPAAYSNPKGLSSYFAAYDGKGDLYVSGTAKKTHKYLLSVLPHDRTAMSSVAISGGTLYFPERSPGVHDARARRSKVQEKGELVLLRAARIGHDREDRRDDRADRRLRRRASLDWEGADRGRRLLLRRREQRRHLALSFGWRSDRQGERAADTGRCHSKRGERSLTSPELPKKVNGSRSTPAGKRAYSGALICRQPRA